MAKTKPKAKKKAPAKKSVRLIPTFADDKRKIVAAGRKREGELDNALDKRSKVPKGFDALAAKAYADSQQGVGATAEELAELEAMRRHDAEVKAAAEKLRAEELARWKKLGLIEVPVKGTTLTLLGMPDPHKHPLTMEQRVEMAKRLNKVGPLLPKYVQRWYNPEVPGKSTTDIINHAAEYNEETMAEKKRRESLISKEQQEKMEAIGRGAMAVIAKHDPGSASAAFLSGKKFKSKDKAVTPTAAKGKPAAAPAPKVKAKLQPEKIPAGGFNKSNRPATSGELIRSLIIDHKLDDDQIATLTRKLFEGRNTKVSDVRWNRGQMRNAGITAPDPVGGEPQKGKKK